MEDDSHSELMREYGLDDSYPNYDDCPRAEFMPTYSAAAGSLSEPNRYYTRAHVERYGEKAVRSTHESTNDCFQENLTPVLSSQRLYPSQANTTTNLDDDIADFSSSEAYDNDRSSPTPSHRYSERLTGGPGLRGKIEANFRYSPSQQALPTDDLKHCALCPYCRSLLPFRLLMSSFQPHIRRGLVPRGYLLNPIPAAAIRGMFMVCACDR